MAGTEEPVKIAGDFTPVRLDFGGELLMVLVGEDQDAARITVTILNNRRYQCAIADEGRWTSPPMPYAPGLDVKVVIVDTAGRAREIRATMPGPDALGPVFGKGWIGFGPRA